MLRSRGQGGLNPERLILSAFLLVVAGLASSVALFAFRGWDVQAARPWSMVEVLWAYRGLPPYAGDLWKSLAVGVMAAGGLLAVALTSRKKAIFGDARFARRGELGRNRLCDRTGVLLGKVGGRWLCNDEPLHVLVCAPTRSGKGVGIVVPNLFAWEGSLVVLDIKGENFSITSGYRAKCGKVFKFSPMSTATHRYNPLDAVRKDVAHRLSDLQQLATILVVPPDRVTMWEAEARDLLDRVLDKMPDDLRSVFVLFELEELTVDEVAALLGLPRGTVATRLRRARVVFQKQAKAFEHVTKGNDS